MSNVYIRFSGEYKRSGGTREALNVQVSVMFFNIESELSAVKMGRVH